MAWLVAGFFHANIAAAQSVAVPQFVNETGATGILSRFENSDDPFVVGGGVATLDCDNSGLPSVYLTAGTNAAKFYRNTSAPVGPLRLIEEQSGLETINAIGAYPLDIDSDGNMDMVVLRVGTVQVFRGLGKCKFELANDRWAIHTPPHWHTAFSATWEPGHNMPTLAFGTYTDLARERYPWGTCTPAVLYRAAPGASQYDPPTKLEPSHCALSMLFSDWGRSDSTDLRVANDREYYKNGQEQLWQVRPDQPPRLYTPNDGFKPLQIWGMGIASRDLDGDGYPEVFVTSMADNKLQKLDSTTAPLKPSYSDIAYRRGATAHRPYTGGEVRPSTAWHAQFEDVNHDGLADLWIVKGNVSTMPDFAAKDPNNLLLQKPDGTFEEAGDKAGIVTFLPGRGGMLADLNADGLLDMVVVHRLENANVWRNTSKGLGNWLQLRLHQDAPNVDAVGAWIEVDLGGRTLWREHTIGGGHASGHLGWLHFGVGDAKQVKVRVRWPHAPAAQDSDWQTLQANGFYQWDRAKGPLPWQHKAP